MRLHPTDLGHLNSYMWFQFTRPNFRQRKPVSRNGMLKWTRPEQQPFHCSPRFGLVTVRPIHDMAMFYCFSCLGSGGPCNTPTRMLEMLFIKRTSYQYHVIAPGGYARKKLLLLLSWCAVHSKNQRLFGPTEWPLLTGRRSKMKGLDLFKLMNNSDHGQPFALQRSMGNLGARWSLWLTWSPCAPQTNQLVSSCASPTKPTRFRNRLAVFRLRLVLGGVRTTREPSGLRSEQVY